MRRFIQFCLITTLAVSGAWLWADGMPDFDFIRGARKIRASATSTLREKNKPAYFYSAARAVDGKLATAWCAGKKGGIGESLSIRFSPRVADGVYVMNGYGATRRLYYANNRIKEIEFTITYRNGRRKKFRRRISPKLCGHSSSECPEDPSNPYYKECKQQERRDDRICHYVGTREGYGMDEGQIPLKFEAACIIGVRAKVLAVYRGRKYNDTCMAELQPVERPERGSSEQRQAARKACR